MRRKQEYDRRRKKSFDNRRKDFKLAVGDYVLVYVADRRVGNKGKDAAPFIGPYRVVQKLHHNNFKLLRPHSRKTAVFSGRKLKRFCWSREEASNPQLVTDDLDVFGKAQHRGGGNVTVEPANPSQIKVVLLINFLQFLFYYQKP